MEMGAHSTKSENKNPTSLEVQPACEAITSIQPEGKFVIVYLHGLTMDAHEADALVAACQESFGDQVINISPKCREGQKSIYLSLDEQAKKVVAEVKTILHNNYPQYSEEELKALPIYLFGYSQGGLIACVIAANYRNELNIKSIIAAHAPLSGTDVLENTKSDVNEFNSKAKAGLKAIGHPNTSLSEAKILGVLLNSAWSRPAINLIARGIRDMRKNSTCIANIKAFIRDGNHSIPILLIAGYISDLNDYFNFVEEDKEQVDALNEAYASLITNKKDGLHDLLIPIQRQLCRTESFENLATDEDISSVYPSHVKVYIAEETIHCYNLVPIFSDFTVSHGKTLFESEETIDVIINFITKQLDQDNPNMEK